MPMPPLPASHNTVKLNVRHTLGDDTNVENVLHGVYNSTHAPLSTADLARFCMAMTQLHFRDSRDRKLTSRQRIVTDRK